MQCFQLMLLFQTMKALDFVCRCFTNFLLSAKLYRKIGENRETSSNEVPMLLLGKIEKYYMKRIWYHGWWRKRNQWLVAVDLSTSNKKRSSSPYAALHVTSESGQGSTVYPASSHASESIIAFCGCATDFWLPCCGRKLPYVILLTRRRRKCTGFSIKYDTLSIICAL